MMKDGSRKVRVLAFQTVKEEFVPAPASCPTHFLLLTPTTLVLSIFSPSSPSRPTPDGMPKSSRTCEYCGTSYSKKEHYERHVRTHTRERPFNCVQCASKFSRRDALSRHIRICHPQGNQQDNSRIETPGTVDASAPDVPQPHRPLPPAEQNGFLRDLFHDSNGGRPVQSPPINLADFGWQWDDTLNLDSTFSIDDLCNFDPSTVDLSTPWMPPPHSSGELDVPPFQTSSGPVNSLLRPQASPQWFTHIAYCIHRPGLSTELPRACTPATTAEVQISRDALADSLVLKQPVPNTALPSATFLNRCIYTFTTRLWPVVPVVHLPSFKPAQTNPMLLLAICLFGASADGSKQALYYAGKLYEGLQKAILVFLTPDRPLDKNSLAVLQAAVIGHTFALLCGDPQYLISTAAFHSALFICLRKSHNALFGSQPQPGPAPYSLEAKDWDDWVAHQTLIRVFNAVHVHNGEIAAIMQQPASHRTQPLMIPVAAPDNLFLAKTSDEWVSIQHAQPTNSLPPRSTLSSCAILECFIGEISHARSSQFHVMSDQDVDAYQRALHTWFLESAESFRADAHQRFTMLTLWHSCFLLLLCDVNLVEKVCGRDGDSISNTETQQLRDWMLTPRARQCVSHAVLLCRLTDDVRVCDVPAAHVARSLWHAGLVLAMYSFLAQTQPLGDDLSNATTDRYGAGIEALRQVDFLTEHDLDILTEDATSTRCGTLAFGVSTTLRHFGPWPAAACYANTLDQVLTFNESRWS
jgi:hypothetical protein